MSKSDGAKVRKLILDVLKPHSPSIHELALKIAGLDGVESVDVALAEIDQATESVKVSIEGGDIHLSHVKKAVEDVGASIHSVDEVTVVKKGHVPAKT